LIYCPQFHLKNTPTPKIFGVVLFFTMDSEFQGASAQGLTMQTPIKVAASSSHTPFKVSQTPSKQASKLVKVVFNLTHEPSSQTEEVWVFGTDTSLDQRQMQRTSFKDNGSTIWTTYCYSPELIEFEYRYTSKEPGFDVSVWEGNHMRKCRVPSHAAGKVELEDKWGIIPLPVPLMAEEPVATPAKTPGASGFNMSINGSGFLSPLLLEGPPVTREAMATSFEALKGLVERTKRDLKRMKEKNESLEQQVAQRALESGTLTETLAQCEQERAESTARLHSLEQFVCSVEQAWGMSRKELLMSAAPMIKDAEGRKLQQYLAAATEAQQQLRAQAQQQLADVQQQLTITVAAITEQVGLQFKQMEDELTDTRSKHRKEMQERKRLHNQLLELRGNIRVFCRVRPLNSREKDSCVSFPEEANICIEQGKGKDAKVFQFDHVFGPQSTQSEVFEETQPLITSMLDGYNVCIFAYGQTGTGKTHTMEGYGDQPGVNTRALQALFDLAKERKKLFTYDIKVSILEIYNETLVDLLVGRSGAKLEVKPHPEGGTHVPELTVVPVTCMQDVQRLMDKGKANRSVGATCMNEHSSRSHCILSVYTESRAVATGARAQGKLHLIDLAGSERVGRSGATGDRLKEAQNINQSLSALGDVVAALIAKQKHVPFRNSKLTFFLQDSLGGDSKALMFVQGVLFLISLHRQFTQFLQPLPQLMMQGRPCAPLPSQPVCATSSLVLPRSAPTLLVRLL
jgi:kinesin family protein C2/C3